MSRRHFWALLLVAAPVAASAATFSYGPLRESAVKKYSRPEIGATAEAEIGQSLIEEGRVAPAVEVLEAFTTRITGNAVILHPGTYGIVAENDDGQFFQGNPPITLKFGFSSPWPDGGVFIPKDPASPPQAYYRSAVGLTFHGPVQDLKFRSGASLALSGGFKRELIYGGVSKGVVKLSYREFVDNLARPAFTQEISYDLADGDEIGFHGARFKVLKATNTSITFTLLRAMIEQQP
jgi:hypothetical protein